ncbi:pyruvate dehydrogenase complex dihydrolipoamide acetyltransferase [Sphingoaurantiacus capsulatus]|uniref:Acetyltransferase component of pyruvate dehydrogenase complex n=1 Tax=Sphingoaurantiacus capsulatus TaxID=1771310 RepID=A0ABV7XBX1_9SPHN
MPIDITMPALSPTMETGTLAKWLVKEGDTIKPGDVIAEIETDKATMEVEAVDEGTIVKLLVAEGTDEVPVGKVIAVLAEEGEEVSAAAAPKEETKAEPKAAEKPAEPAKAETPAETKAEPKPEPKAEEAPKAAAPAPAPAPAKSSGDRVKASPLARRLAEAKGVDLASLTGSGPNGRIVKADLDKAPAGAGAPATAGAAPSAAAAPVAAPIHGAPEGVPAETIKLSNMRKTIARRLAESKQTVPHFYLTIDVRLDPLLKLRSQLNAALSEDKKLSVNDLVIKALALALIEVPDANVQFAGDNLYKFGRADISVAVAIPGGLITPVIRDADNKRLSQIAVEMKDLAARARDGKLKPEEFSGGTASLSNLGMFGIKQFDAVINPPQAMILAVGSGEKRPYVVDDALAIATVMSATGSFDHRAIDGAVGAQLMAAFKRLVENPLAMLA